MCIDILRAGRNGYGGRGLPRGGRGRAEGSNGLEGERNCTSCSSKVMYSRAPKRKLRDCFSHKIGVMLTAEKVRLSDVTAGTLRSWMSQPLRNALLWSAGFSLVTGLLCSQRLLVSCLSLSIPASALGYQTPCQCIYKAHSSPSASQILVHNVSLFSYLPAPKPNISKREPLMSMFSSSPDPCTTIPCAAAHT